MKTRKMSIALCSALLSAGLMLAPQAVLADGHGKKVEQKKLNVKTIDFAKVQELFNAKNTLFLDARPMKLYSKGTIMGALNFPTKGMNKGMLPADKSTTIVTFCNGADCEKSTVLANKIEKLGYTNVYAYINGYPEWEEKKQPSMSMKKAAGKQKATAQGSFKATIDATEVNGVKFYLLPEDGEANEDGVIDQFWFMDQLKTNGVPKGITLVDVRKKEKYDVEHLKGAINIPFDSDNESLDVSKLPKDGIVVFYCNTGLKSTDARGSLEDDVAERVFIFDATYKCDKEYKNCKLTPNEAL